MNILPSTLIAHEAVAERSMAFRFTKPEGFAFKPGRAIDLVLDGMGTEEGANRHAFSIVSAPHERDLTIATRMRDSAYKRALGALAVGAAVGIDGPFGSLGLPRKLERPVVLIAGGIGITPFMSMLRDAKANARAQDLLLVYANRRPQDAAFLDELTRMAQANPRFRLLATMTDAELPASEWSGARQRIDADFLRSALRGINEPICLVAGPPVMVGAVRQALVDAEIDEDDVRSEDFHGY